MNRAPTADEANGIAWFNALDDRGRAEWLRVAGSARPVDAWGAYKAQQRGCGWQAADHTTSLSGGQ